MYQSLGQRGDAKEPAGAHARLEGVEDHVGPWHDFLRRHEHDADRAARQGLTGVRSLAPVLLQRVADARNLRAAAQYLVQRGERAPGPNGLRLTDLDDSELWEMGRVLGAAIHDGTYHAGPGRSRRIPKETGSRELCIEDSEDKVVGRSIVNIVQPLLDSLFDDRSNGYRPGRGRQQALAQAMTVSQQTDRNVWMTTDLETAFDRVPLKRLGDVLRLCFPAELVQLMLQVAGNGKHRGLKQGQPLSPWLLNVYLHHVLDRVWRKLHPQIPCCRTADDILVICHSKQEASQVLAELNRLLRPAGMLLSQDATKNGIADLVRGESATWLGMEITLIESRYRIGLTEKIWRKLSVSLENTYEMPQPARSAHALVRDWVRQIGMCYQDANRTQVCERIVSLARERAHEEMPSLQSLLRDWRQAYRRWRRLLKEIGRAQGKIGGTACHCVFAAIGRGSAGAPLRAPALPFSKGVTVTLYSDGSCDRGSGTGGWAAILRAPGLKPIRLAARLRRTTNNRAELTAVIRGLEHLDCRSPVHIVTDSAYVAAGISTGVFRWKAQGWRAGAGRHKRPLQNADLWQQLYELVAPRTVTCRWVRGHSGNTWNDECDRLARAVAKR